MSKLVAVTGAAGFIGASVVDGCAEHGFAVRRLVRNSAALDARSSAVGEIGPTTHWARALEGVDCVIHCAGRAHVLNETSADALAEFRRVNRDGTLRLAEEAVLAGVRRLIFLSSVGVMGHGTDGRQPFTEFDAPRPMADYAVSKWEAEQGLGEISRRTGLEVVILRPPMVHGPAAPGNFNRLIHALARGTPLPLAMVTGNRRSYVGIHNLVNLIITCIDHSAAASRTFFVSDGEDVSTADLLRRIGEMLSIPPRLVPVPVWMLRLAGALAGRAATVQSLCGSFQVDSTMAGQLLGWRPPLSLNQGLMEAAKGYWREATV